MRQQPLSAETIAECAAGLGCALTLERARAIAAAANPVFASTAARAQTLPFEAEPATFLAELERGRQP